MKLHLWAILAVGCGGGPFEFGGAPEGDAGAIDGPLVDGSGGSATPDAGPGGAGAGGTSTGALPGAGGAAGGTPNGTGGTTTDDAGTGGGTGEEAGVPQPPCCVDADCPASIPFCAPWGTCYQGGDPYNCDYDAFCESFCVHCSGSVAGACEEKRCVCS